MISDGLNWPGKKEKEPDNQSINELFVLFESDNCRDDKIACGRSAVLGDLKKGGAKTKSAQPFGLFCFFRRTSARLRSSPFLVRILRFPRILSSKLDASCSESKSLREAEAVPILFCRPGRTILEPSFY
jgi:hypothetical protein